MIKKYFSPFCLLISIIILIYTFYKSEIYWEGNKRNYYNIYYVISFILIFFSLLTFKIKNKFKTYLMIISLSTIFSLYAFEVYIIYKNRTVLVEKDLKKRTQIYESKSNKIYDRRSKLEVYNDLVKQNKDIVTTVFPYKFVEKKNLDFFPLSGISKSKTINCNESGFYATY